MCLGSSSLSAIPARTGLRSMQTITAASARSTVGLTLVAALPLKRIRPSASILFRNVRSAILRSSLIGGSSNVDGESDARCAVCAW